MIHFDNYPDLRPTLNRVREAAANLVAPFSGSHGFVDVCAGTGALGFEAVSMGFEPVVMLDTNPRAVDRMRANAERLAASPSMHVASAFNIEQVIAPGVWVIYADPPFRDEDFHERFMAHCSGLMHIAAGSVYVAERARNTDSDPLPGWALEKEKKYGKIRIELWRKLDALASA